MSTSRFAGSALEHLQAARASALALRDKAFLEISRQKALFQQRIALQEALLRQHTALLSDVNAELAFRATDKKRAEAAEEIKKLRGKARLQLMLRLLRFYIHTRYVNPIVAKPIFSGQTVILSFRLDLNPGEEPGATELWHTIRLNALGERVMQVDRRHLQRGPCLLTTHPREWGF